MEESRSPTRTDELVELALEVKKLKDAHNDLQKRLDQKDNVISNLAVALRKIEEAGKVQQAPISGQDDTGSTGHTLEELGILAAEALKRLEKSDFWRKNRSIRASLGEMID